MIYSMRGNDLTLKQFGRLTAISVSGKSKSRNLIWLCVCDCGNNCNVESRNLINGSTMSCGCLQREIVSTCKKYDFANIRRESQPRLYRTWINIKSRCFNPKANKYFNYGGRGITMSSQWVNDFKAFYDWSISHGYSDNLTIDRIDVNGNYEPANCRWATYKDQNMNKRNSK